MDLIGGFPVTKLRRRRSHRSIWGVGIISLFVVALFALVLADPQGLIFGTQPIAAAGTVPKLATLEVQNDDGGSGDPLLVSVELTTAALLEQFEQNEYELADVRDGIREVPRLYLESLPADLREIEAVVTRKQFFIQTMLPLVLRANEKVWATRDILIDIAERIHAALPLSESERGWLDQLAARYETDPGNLEELFKRVDVVPPSLALAQSAVESGWGTSRFAREGNALFGQRVFREGAGIVPEERDAGTGHEVLAFEALGDSVTAYLHNLNTHWAYDEFRDRREMMRAEASWLESADLIAELVAYSEEREKYLKILKRVIRENRLEQFDHARLNRLQLVVDLDPAYR